jgi:Skp family chaperone for outer membrane proteins|tara:strand:- start:11272 stop:11868 length:597 start_codon:yes stop_codon:yes gene_type:complete
MKNTIVVAFLALFAVTGAFAQSDSSVGAVNMQRLLAGYTAYQSALEKYEGAISPAEEELANLQKKLQDMQANGQELESKKDNPALSKDARKEAQSAYETLSEEFRALGAQFQVFQNQTQQLRNQSRQEFLLPLELKARETIVTVAEDKDVDLVVEIAPVDVKEDEEKTYSVYRGTVLYASESLDLTDSVIAVLNAAGE